MTTKGIGYDGDKGTSTANQELIVKPNNWTHYQMYEFNFLNTQACTVKINGKTIPLSAEQGVVTNENDAPIYSFIIEDSGIGYNWFGKY